MGCQCCVRGAVVRERGSWGNPTPTFFVTFNRVKIRTPGDVENSRLSGDSYTH